MVHIVTAHWNEDLKWLYDLKDEHEYFTISVCDKLTNPNYAGSGECDVDTNHGDCLLYTSPSPRDKRQSRMPSSA